MVERLIASGVVVGVSASVCTLSRELQVFRLGGAERRK
jgi:hypothetical protein